LRSIISRRGVVLRMTDWKIWVWGLVGYLWSVVDDNPLNADMILGLGFGFYVMELVLRVLTIFCFYMAIRTATRGRKIPWRAGLLTVIAFLLTFADDFRYSLGLGFISNPNWVYLTTLILNSFSLPFLVFAVQRAKHSRT